MTRTRQDIVRDNYRAYETGDRSLLEPNLAEDFTFYSPPDPGIDLAAYWERCWPSGQGVTAFEIVRMIEAGDEVVVTYEAARQGGRRFRNTEVHTFAGDRVVRVEVYFGWNLEP